MDLDEEAAEARRMMGSFNVRVDKGVVVAKQMLATYYIPALHRLKEKVLAIRGGMLDRWHTGLREAIEALGKIRRSNLPLHVKGEQMYKYKDGILEWQSELVIKFLGDMDKAWKEFRTVLEEAVIVEEVLFHVPALDTFRAFMHMPPHWKYAEEEQESLLRLSDFVLAMNRDG